MALFNDNAAILAQAQDSPHKNDRRRAPRPGGGRPSVPKRNQQWRRRGGRRLPRRWVRVAVKPCSVQTGDSVARLHRTDGVV